MYNVKDWRHVFKIDPNKEISDEALEAVCESGTDAILVGGSDGVTLENTLNVMSRIRRYAVPCVLEVSSAEALTPGFDFYFIPIALNSRKTDWITDFHHQALKEYGDVMNWEEIMAEGYCILNPDSKVAKLTDAKTDLDKEDVVAYARLAERLYGLPIFYVEYSGMYGDPDLVKRVGDVLEETQLFYGGGISSEKEATEMAQFADTIVVGNIIYEDLSAALRTVAAVKKETRG